MGRGRCLENLKFGTPLLPFYRGYVTAVAYASSSSTFRAPCSFNYDPWGDGSAARRKFCFRRLSPSLPVVSPGVVSPG